MAQPVKMPPDKWAKLIDPMNEMDSEEENTAVDMVLARLRELTAILIFRLSGTHSESVSITRQYRQDLVRDLDKLWDKYGVRRTFGGEDNDD
jgi:lipoate-protein ligase A